MSASTALTLEQGMASLASIVGQEHVALRDEASPAIVTAPADAQQIAEVLKFATANGLVVMPSGGRTKLGWGNPVAPDIELSLARLNQVREHAWQDMTCTVQAGCAWAAMQDQLRRHGQMVALDPLWPDLATVGGVVAVNDSGALRLKYGGLRDVIIGMTVVLADGTIAKSGGKVVKNVAGYDIHKLMTGSFGTLGVIVEVNFRLHPVEEHARTWTAMLREEGGCAAFSEPLRALIDSQIVPSGVQMRISGGACAVDIRVAGLPECMDEYGARIQNIFGRLPLVAGTENVWGARQALFEKKDALVLKVSVLPAEIAAIGEDLRQWSVDRGCEIEMVAQATGLMTVAIIAAPDAAVALLDRLRALMAASAGSVVALQAPGEWREKIDVWGPDRGTLPLMREIKRRFDPNRVLNPGRFVGNI
jgi:glycolate oxidase FAD binding subunit